MLDLLIGDRDRLKPRPLMPRLAALRPPRRPPQTALASIRRRLGQPVRGRRPRRVARVRRKPHTQLSHLGLEPGDQRRLRRDQRLKLLIARLPRNTACIHHGCKLPCKPSRSCSRPNLAPTELNSYIQKWLRSGVIEDGEWSSTETGTAQGASVSPLLSNVFLHYVFECATNVKRGDAVGSRLSMQCSTEDGGLMALRDRPMGDDAKPPHAALVSDRRGERCGHGARDASGGGHGDDRC